MLDLMVDIETLATRPNAVVLSIGAHFFDPLFVETNSEFGSRSFYAILDIQPQLNAGLQVDADTLSWWVTQAAAWPDPEKAVAPANALLELIHFVDELKPYFSKKVWFHGASFDAPILENLFRVCLPNTSLPWNFRNIRDTRTLFDIAGYKFVNQGKHNALQDAICQARGVQEAYALLRKV